MVKKKFRSAESYLGNTPGAKLNQRSNLTPGNTWQKRKIGQLRSRLFWESCNLESKQMIYEYFKNERMVEDVPKRELKGEKHIDNWWNQKYLEEKKSISKEVLSWQTPKYRARHFKRMNKYLKEELAVLFKG